MHSSKHTIQVHLNLFLAEHVLDTRHELIFKLYEIKKLIFNLDMSLSTFDPTFDPTFTNPFFDRSLSTYDPFFDRSMLTSPYDYVPAGSDIATRFPRHVGSRVLRTMEGDIVWRPASDIFETQSDIVIHCDLPGVPKEEINIDVQDEQLIISGTHKGVEGFESASSRVRERRIGKFRKIVRIPSGTDPEKIQAKAENGLLEVKVRLSISLEIRFPKPRVTRVNASISNERVSNWHFSTTWRTCKLKF